MMLGCQVVASGGCTTQCKQLPYVRRSLSATCPHDPLQAGAPPDDAGAGADGHLPAAHPGGSGAAGTARRSTCVLHLFHQPRWAQFGLMFQWDFGSSLPSRSLPAGVQLAILCCPGVAPWLACWAACQPSQLARRPVLIATHNRAAKAATTATCQSTALQYPLPQARTRPMCAGCWTHTLTCSWCSRHHGSACPASQVGDAASTAGVRGRANTASAAASACAVRKLHSMQLEALTA